MLRLLNKLCLFIFFVLSCSAVLAEQENVEFSLGKSIYHEGIGRDGREIGATLHDSVPITGASVACAGCHGQEGEGSAEAFIRAPN
ncbi:MAG: hypothetical protein OEX11_09160, partial [Nitrosomonas sp.]|nr:hypothetical protein [Nitrosomonas sp.]